MIRVWTDNSAAGVLDRSYQMVFTNLERRISLSAVTSGIPSATEVAPMRRSCGSRG